MGLLGQLTEWYWRYGHRRSGNQTLPSDWLATLYAMHEFRDFEDQRKAVLWSPSDTLSLRLLTRMCDLPPLPVESLSARAIAISMDTDSREANDNAKVGSFDVTLLTQRGLLRALAVGYALARRSDVEQRTITPDYVLTRLDEVPATADGPVADATAFVHDIFSALEDVSMLEVKRFEGFVPGGGWRSVIFQRMVGNAQLTSSIENARRFAESLFWESDSEISEFFATASGLLELVGDVRSKQVQMSKAALDVLLESSFAFSKAARTAQKKQAKNLDTPLVVHRGERVISIELDKSPKSTGPRRIKTTAQAAILGGLIAHVNLPAHGELRIDGPKGHLVGAPPLGSLPDEASEFTLEDILRCGKAMMFSRLLAADGAGVAVCFLAPPDGDPIPAERCARVLAHSHTPLVISHPVGPDQDSLADQITAVWNQVERQSGTTLPAPEIVPATWIGDLGETGWPQSAQDSRPAAAKDKLFDKSLNNKLSNYVELAHKQIPDRTRPKPLDLISQALPPSDESHRDAFMALCEAIADYCSAPSARAERRESVMAMSALLREAFSFRPEDFEPLPRSLGEDHARALDWVNQQLSGWASGSRLTALFSALDFEDAHRRIVVKGMLDGFDGDSCANWLCREFGHLETSRDIRHARRYAAVRLSQALFAWDRAPRREFDMRPEVLQNILDEWTDGARDHQETMHYQVVLAPMINALADTADSGATWVRQPGDDEIERLFREATV